MKVSSNQVAEVLRDPSRFAGILIYGDDWGMVRDRSLAAIRAVVGPGSDPFRSTVLTRDEHGRLRDEVSSLPLGGGRRAIRVQDATDGLASVLEPLVVHRADALVVLEASALTPRSKLRLMAERNPHWAVIACYPEGAAAVSREIRRVLESAGLSVTAEALEFLAEELAGDSVRRRSELEKLALFAAEAGTVDQAAVEACCATRLDASLGAAVSAALGGQLEACDRLLDELEREGATGPGLLAVFSMQLHRVLRVRAMMDAGQSLDEACKNLLPPVFPRQMVGFQREVRQWSTFSIGHLAQAVREADVACKKAGSRDFAVAARLISSAAARASVRA